MTAIGKALVKRNPVVASKIISRRSCQIVVTPSVPHKEPEHHIQPFMRKRSTQHCIAIDCSVTQLGFCYISSPADGEKHSLGPLTINSKSKCVGCRFNTVVEHDGTVVAFGGVSTSTRPDPPAGVSGAVEVATRRENNSIALRVVWELCVLTH